MNKQSNINSSLEAKASEELAEKILEELLVEDPAPEKAKAILDGIPSEQSGDVDA